MGYVNIGKNDTASVINANPILFAESPGVGACELAAALLLSLSLTHTLPTYLPISILSSVKSCACHLSHTLRNRCGWLSSYLTPCGVEYPYVLLNDERSVSMFYVGNELGMRRQSSRIYIISSLPL